jgi:hypothetical protein
MIFGQTGFRCQLVETYFSAKAGTKHVHGTGQAFVKLYTCGLPHGWQLVYNSSNVVVLMQMIGQQGR